MVGQPVPRHNGVPGAHAGRIRAAALLAHVDGAAGQGAHWHLGRWRAPGDQPPPRREHQRRRVRSLRPPPAADAGGARGRRHARAEAVVPPAARPAREAVEEGEEGPATGLACRGARLGRVRATAGRDAAHRAISARNRAARCAVVRHRRDLVALAEPDDGPARARRHRRCSRGTASEGRGSGARRGSAPAGTPVEPDGARQDRSGLDDRRRRLRQASVAAAGQALPAFDPGPRRPGVQRARVRGQRRERQGRHDPATHPGDGGRRLQGGPDGGADNRGAPVPLPVALLAPASPATARWRSSTARGTAVCSSSASRASPPKRSGSGPTTRSTTSSCRSSRPATSSPSSGWPSAPRSSSPGSPRGSRPRTSSTRSPRRTTGTASVGTSTCPLSTTWCCRRQPTTLPGPSCRPTTSATPRIKVLETVVAGLEALVPPKKKRKSI